MPLSIGIMESLSTQYTSEVKGRAVAYGLDRLYRYKSVYGACQDLEPKLNIGAEIKALKAKDKDLVLAETLTYQRR